MSDRENIVKLAQVIQDAMREYVVANPEGSYTDACKVGMKAAMVFGKGCYNPSFINSMVSGERSVFENSSYSLPC